MKTLYLSGYGVSLSVNSGKLHVKSGKTKEVATPQETVLIPKLHDCERIVIYGHSGNISLDAIKWIAKQDINLIVLNWDGRLLTNIVRPEVGQGQTRLEQYKASESDIGIGIGQKIIEAKIANSRIVLDWICSRYPSIKEEKASCFKEIEDYAQRLANAKSRRDILGIEGMVARNHWEIISSVFDKKLDFLGRNCGKTGKPMGAIDHINALFNYGYAILESECWRAANANGLDPYVGFIHESTKGKAPLIYDLQEPFRWLVDVAIINALEHKTFKRSDFILTENYNMRLRPEAAAKLTEELDRTFSIKSPYNKKNFDWTQIISMKVGELGDYLDGKCKTIDFTSPVPSLIREDSVEIRSKILSIGYNEWMKAGNSKGSLFYLKKNASSDKPFKVYGKVKERLDSYVVGERMCEDESG